MSEYKEYFKGKKITVMGLGLLGRGLGDALFLAECGAELIVTDLKSAADLEESAAILRPYPNVTLVLGEHRTQDFENRDFILVAAGVPQKSEYVAHAKKYNVPLRMSGALLAQLSGLPVIGVTGTRGKSTVTHMIFYTLQQAGKRALLGGNVRNVSNLQLLNQAAAADLLVLELDSWQLQGFGWLELSPHIAVFTNLMPDHLNYYENMDAYFNDKANIYHFQKPGDILIVDEPTALEWIVRRPAPFGQKIVGELPEGIQLQIPGEHNRQNAALAAEALRAYGLSEEGIKNGLESFSGVEGRLQYVRAVGEVEIYNDNNATTPNATSVALKAVSKGKNVVLICGGSDKGVELDVLIASMKDTVKHVVLYSGTGTEVLKGVLPSEIPYVEHETLKECVHAALAVAAPGDVVLFSPAFASFGKEFKNEYDRNDQFLAIIKNI